MTLEKPPEHLHATKGGFNTSHDISQIFSSEIFQQEGGVQKKSTLFRKVARVKRQILSPMSAVVCDRICMAINKTTRQTFQAHNAFAHSPVFK